MGIELSEGNEVSERKIRVECSCGKPYRVAAANQGRKITCKVCGAKVRVPRDSAVSERSRVSILGELGIDSESARRAYAEEKLRETPQPRVYSCMRCEGRILASELRGAYKNGELLCTGCRATDEVEDRRREEEGERDLSKMRDALTRERTWREEMRAALLSSSAHGALYFTGAFGPAYLVLGWRFATALALGLGVSLVGALVVYVNRRGIALI